MLAELYRSVRLFVNHFQPSFKLAAKSRDGAKVRKRYYLPATPYQRLLADARVPEEVRTRLQATHVTLDPVRLLREIRAAQERLVGIADRAVGVEQPAPTVPTLQEFLAGLRTAWQEGEVRPTAKPKPQAKRLRRRPDPLGAGTVHRHAWFEEQPWQTSRQLLDRLQSEVPGTYPDKLLRTLQRRVKHWRHEAAHRMVFGTTEADEGAGDDAATGMANEATGVRG